MSYYKGKKIRKAKKKRLSSLDIYKEKKKCTIITCARLKNYILIATFNISQL